MSPTAIHKGCRNLDLSVGDLPQDLTQSRTWKFSTVFPLSFLYVVSVTDVLLSKIEQAVCCSGVCDGVWESNLKTLGSSPPHQH